MSIEPVKAFFKTLDQDYPILEFDQSSATVELAAQALGVIPGRIAKTLSLKKEETAFLIVTAGDVKLDNQKFKAEFGFKAKFLSPEEVLHFTGHEIGGVCPFGLKEKLDIYLDVSLQNFTTVFPACGSRNSAVELTFEDLEQLTLPVKWVDVCRIKDLT